MDPAEAQRNQEMKSHQPFTGDGPFRLFAFYLISSGSLPAVGGQERKPTEADKSIGGGFGDADTGNSETKVYVIISARSEARAGRGIESITGATIPVTTSNHALITRIVIRAIRGTFLPFLDIPSLTHRPVGAASSSLIDRSGSWWYPTLVIDSRS